MAATGGPADVTVVCVDVPGCEGGAILGHGRAAARSSSSRWRPRSPAAALGAEGLAADVTMLVGNGYTPGHAAYAMDLLRGQRTAYAACSSGGCDGSDDDAATGGKLDLDPATVRKARSLARKVGRPIVRIAQQHTTVSVERATLRLAGLEGADAEGTPWVNRLVDVVRADVGLEHGVALPVWDAAPPRRGRRPARARREGVRRLGDVPPARRARTPSAPRPRRRAPGRARASSASTPAARSASG